MLPRAGRKRPSRPGPLYMVSAERRVSWLYDRSSSWMLVNAEKTLCTGRDVLDEVIRLSSSLCERSTLATRKSALNAQLALEHDAPRLKTKML